MRRHFAAVTTKVVPSLPTLFNMAVVCIEVKSIRLSTELCSVCLCPSVESGDQLKTDRYDIYLSVLCCTESSKPLRRLQITNNTVTF